jgi:hypothetical protein
MKIPSMTSVESSNSQKTAMLYEKYAKMMENIEIVEPNSSAFKLISNYNTNENH